MNSDYLKQIDRRVAFLEKELHELKQEKALILSCSIPTTIGGRLKKARLMQGLSIPQLGARANVLCSDIVALEADQSHKMKALEVLSEVLGVSYKYLRYGKYINDDEKEAFNIYSAEYIDVSQATLKDLNWDTTSPATVKAIHALEREGLITIEDVVTKQPKELMKIRSFGVSCLEKLKDALVRSNIPLKGEWSVCV